MEWSKTSEANDRRPAMFYLAGLLASLTGQAATATAVESTGLFFVTAILTSVGYFVSSNLRERGRSLRVVEGLVIAICFATYARLFLTGETTPFFSPGKALFHKELSLAVMLVWAEVVRSYSLVSDEALLFTAVPSLALIGVVATTGNDQVLLFFALWLFACVLMFVEAGRHHAAAAGARRSLRAATLAGAIGVACLVTGLLASPLIHRGSMWMFVALAPEIYTSRHPVDLVTGDAETNLLQISEGPVRLSSREEMTVMATDSAYWRTRVWDIYLGRDWKSSRSVSSSRRWPVDVADTYIAEGLRGSVQLFRPPEREVGVKPGKLIRQVYISSEGPFSGYLPMAGEAKSVKIRASMLRRDPFNCWQLPATRIQRPDSYEVVSEVPDASADELRESSGDVPEPILRHYTRLPLDASPVAKIAKEVTWRYDNNYDKLLAIQRHLAATCTYDITTPPLPAGERDVVMYFLTQSKRGYCDVFATSMAVMARSIGIPARIATGFATGDYDQERQCYVVREKDRHSWAEVYFPGYGWVPFEATPGTDLASPSFVDSFLAELRLMLQANSRLLLLVTLAGLALLVVKVLFPNDRRDLDVGNLLHSRDPELRRIQRLWKRLYRTLRRRLSIRTRMSTTPMEMAALALDRLPPEATEAREAVERACELLTQTLFARARRSEAELNDLEAAVRMVRLKLGAELDRVLEEIIERQDDEAG